VVVPATARPASASSCSHRPTAALVTADRRITRGTVLGFVRSTCTDATQKCHHCTQNLGFPGHRSTTRSIFASDGTCEGCQAGYHSRCAHLEYVGAGGAQAEYLRIPWQTAPWSPRSASRTWT